MANSYLTKVLLEEDLGHDDVELKLADDVGFRYLSDPKYAMGSVDAPKTLHSATREGFAEKEPAAFALINAMRLDEDQVGSLELAINEAEVPEAGVRRWLEERVLVRPWIEAAKNAQED